MIFEGTSLPGAYLIALERHEDERGFFARAWCSREFEMHGLDPRVAQCNLSYNRRAGTLRGLHYQLPPHAEAKLIRCIRGGIYDVIIDLREDSPTYKTWFGAELSETNKQMLYVPEGFAHGFLALADDTEVFYQASEFYAPDFERGIRWDDPAFGVTWPETERLIISEKDRSWPGFAA